MLFVEYPKCSTCRKAKKWLDSHSCHYEDRNITEQNPTAEELKEWQAKSELPLRKFFNTSGSLYKEMHLKDTLKEMSEEEQFALLATDGMLVKRPILVTEDAVLVGFQESAWEKALKKNEIRNQTKDEIGTSTLHDCQETGAIISQSLHDRFIFREIAPDEANQAVEIERICFPPNEACSEKMMLERVATAPDMFLVAVDKENGKIAGFLNGLATNESKFRDEFFLDASLHDPAGENVLLLGLDVLPEYRRQGLAKEIVALYAAKEQKRGRKRLILTCLEEKVKMYEKMGFRDDGISASAWGDEQWHEMSFIYPEK